MNKIWRVRRSPRHHRERGRWVVDLDVDFSDEELRTIEAAAAAQGVTRDQFLNDALKEWLNRHPVG